MSSVNERFKKVIGIHLDAAKQKAMTNQVFIVKDGNTKEIECVNVRDLPYGEKTIGEVIDLLEAKLEYIGNAFNELAAALNENQEATTNAIADIREELEKGKIL